MRQVELYTAAIFRPTRTGAPHNKHGVQRIKGKLKKKIMEAKKITRYYSECGRGFWSKKKAIIHEGNCTCWKNPALRTCISCKLKSIVKDSNGMEHEPQFLHNFETNNCEFYNHGISVHRDFGHIRKNCDKWINNK